MLNLNREYLASFIVNDISNNHTDLSEESY